jgi:hypothetical protein
VLHNVINIDQLTLSTIRMLTDMTPARVMRFTHIVNSANPTVLESRCMACGSLVAASQGKKYLKIAESAHHCPGKVVAVKEKTI